MKFKNFIKNLLAKIRIIKKTKSLITSAIFFIFILYLIEFDNKKESYQSTENYIYPSVNSKRINNLLSVLNVKELEYSHIFQYLNVISFREIKRYLEKNVSLSEYLNEYKKDIEDYFTKDESSQIQINNFFIQNLESLNEETVKKQPNKYLNVGNFFIISKPFKYL